MFERSWVQIPVLYTRWTFGHFFTLICCKNCIFLFEKTENKRKRGRVWPIFLKKVVLAYKVHQSGPIKFIKIGLRLWNSWNRTHVQHQRTRVQIKKNGLIWNLTMGFELTTSQSRISPYACNYYTKI